MTLGACYEGYPDCDTAPLSRAENPKSNLQHASVLFLSTTSRINQHYNDMHTRAYHQEQLLTHLLLKKTLNNAEVDVVKRLMRAITGSVKTCDFVSQVSKIMNRKCLTIDQSKNARHLMMAILDEESMVEEHSQAADFVMRQSGKSSNDSAVVHNPILTIVENEEDESPRRIQVQT